MLFLPFSLLVLFIVSLSLFFIGFIYDVDWMISFFSKTSVFFGNYFNVRYSYLGNFGNNKNRGFTMTKDKWINIRCTEEQRQDVTEFAKECNMAVSEFFWYLVAKERKESEK